MMRMIYAEIHIDSGVLASAREKQHIIDKWMCLKIPNLDNTGEAFSRIPQHADTDGEIKSRYAIVK